MDSATPTCSRPPKGPGARVRGWDPRHAVDSDGAPAPCGPGGARMRPCPDRLSLWGEGGGGRVQEGRLEVQALRLPPRPSSTPQEDRVSGITKDTIYGNRDDQTTEMSQM